jgi:hypothetical protein
MSNKFKWVKNKIGYENTEYYLYYKKYTPIATIVNNTIDEYFVDNYNEGIHFDGNKKFKKLKDCKCYVEKCLVEFAKDIIINFIKEENL